MRTVGRGAVRAWGAFLLLAAVPVALVVALVLRAASAERVRVSAEHARSRAEAKSRIEADVQGAWRTAATALERLSPAALDVDLGDGRELDRLRATLEAQKPIFADVVIVGPTGEVALPAPPAKEPAPTEACAAARDALTTPGRGAAVRQIIAECTDLRGANGRHLYPLLALEIGGVSIESWVAAHQASLGADERALLRRRVLGTTGEPIRSESARIVSRLDSSVSDRQAIAAALTDPPDDVRLPGLKARAGRARSILRSGQSGASAGYVVHAASLSRLPSPDADLVVAVRARSDGDDVRVAPELFVGLVTRDPLALDARAASASRRVMAWGFAGAALALGVLVALFVRARRAERLAELRTDFVAAVSHELRTPLATVRMLSELLEAGAVATEERVEIDRTIAAESRRLADTLERMLRFGALSRGRLTVTRSRAEVAPVIDEALARFRAAHPGREAIAELDAGASFDADVGLVGLVLDNLLANAAKYAPEGGPYRVSGRREGRAFVLRVSDRGPGLDASARARVFLPFERADDRLSRATEGTGVGLALVRGIARAHGGDATVESAPGRGATFVVRFPDAKEEG